MLDDTCFKLLQDWIVLLLFLFRCRDFIADFHFKFQDSDYKAIITKGLLKYK